MPFQELRYAKALDIRPITTEADYREALRIIEELMTAEPGTPEGERLDVLTTLVESYESKHYPLDLPDPVEAMSFDWNKEDLPPRAVNS